MSQIDNTAQREAIARAKEMYSRRTPDKSPGSFPSGYNGNLKRRTSVNAEKESFPQKNDTVEENSAADEKKQDNGANTDSGKSFLDMLLDDKERTLIVLLLALLSEEKADTSLMLALMYIIM